jgi:uncharacterized protein (TIGR04141 family)
MPMNEKLSLTVFLLKSDQVLNLKQAFLADQNSFALVPQLEGFFIPLPADQRTPTWVSAVQSILQNTNTPDLLSQSPAGFLVLTRGAKTFAITFGHAWQKLKDEWLEIDFGRKVALNSIPRQQLLEIRSEQVFAKWHISNERAPSAASVEEFGVEFDRDLVAVVEGVPTETIAKKLGSPVRGGTSLRVKVPFNTLGGMLDKAGTLFDSNAYKKVWPEIDNVTIVKDDVLVQKLEHKLDAEFTSGMAQANMVMFMPSRRDEESSVNESYVFGRLSKTPSTHPYLTITSWLDYLKAEQKTPSVEEAKASKIHIMDDAKEPVGLHTVFDCFGYELSHGGQQYILSSGNWYEVVKQFINQTNDIANKIDPPKAKLVLWNQGESEREYNLRCAEKRGFLFFDARNVIFGGNQSKFEFCDFLDLKTKTLFFVKIPTQSSGMSHLVEQTRRTAELLFNTDDGYRKALVKVFQKYHKDVDIGWLESRPRHGSWNLCLVSLGKNAMQLPFFARRSLVRAVKDLSERGHAVSFTAS